MLRKRPIRARIYQPVTRFGVVAGDWKYILGISVACYAVPMVLKLSLGGIPLFLIAGPGAMFLTYSFFYWIRIGKDPGWLQHQLRSLLRHEVERGTLAADRASNPSYPWLKRPQE
jgi:hypothetical protein